MNIAIIPSRIGSKRIKKKNIKKFLGKPIILHTLNNIIECNIFDKIIVSSDSEKVFDLCSKIKGIIFHKRLKKYSKDNSSTISAIKSCIKDNQINDNDNVCCVYPCAPMINNSDLKKTRFILNQNKFFFVLPIKKYNHPIERSFRLSKKKKIIGINLKNSKLRTQKLESFYHDVGQFYWGKANSWKKYDSILSHSVGYITNRIEYIDIDNDKDWKLAEKTFEKLKK